MSDKELRQTGTTTRLIDSYIQAFFNSKRVDIKDHHDSLPCHKITLKKFTDRLDNEHPFVKYDVSNYNSQSGYTVTFRGYSTAQANSRLPCGCKCTCGKN